MSGFKALKVPFPPLKVQQEIADTLDSFTGLIENLEREIEVRGKFCEDTLEKLISWAVCHPDIQRRTIKEYALTKSVKMPQLSVGDLDNLVVPLPPLDVQTQVSGKLLTVQRSIREAKEELELRKKQYSYTLDRLFDFARFD